MTRLEACIITERMPEFSEYLIGGTAGLLLAIPAVVGISYEAAAFNERYYAHLDRTLHVPGAQEASVLTTKAQHEHEATGIKYIATSIVLINAATFAYLRRRPEEEA